VSKRILIAEDEVLSRRWITAWLRDMGYEVDEAKDGAEALDLIDRSRFDLVLSDIRMPRVDGVAVLTHLLP
jgi:two-component system response regulator AtoC